MPGLKKIKNLSAADKNAEMENNAKVIDKKEKDKKKNKGNKNKKKYEDDGEFAFKVIKMDDVLT